MASELAKTAVKSGTKLVAATVVGAALSVGGVAYAQQAPKAGLEGNNYVVRNAGLVVSNGDAEISAGGLRVVNSFSAAGNNFSVDHKTGKTTVSSLTATTADINGGTIDDATITGGSINNAAIGGSSSIDTSGDIKTTGTLKAGATTVSSLTSTGKITGTGGMDVSNGKGAQIYMDGQDVVAKGGFVVSEGDAEISAGGLKVEKSFSAAGGNFTVDHKTGNTNVGGNLFVTEGATVEGKLTAKGDADIGSVGSAGSGTNTTVNINTASTGNTNIGGADVSLAGTKSTAVGSTSSETTINGSNVTVNGNTTLNDKLTVRGASELQGNTKIASNVGASATIGNATGKTEVNGDTVTITGTKSVETKVGNSTIETNASGNTLTVGDGGTNTISATGTGKNLISSETTNEMSAAESNTIRAGSGNNYNDITINNTGAADGVIVNAIGTTNGVRMSGEVAGHKATMVLSGTKAALTASTGTGLDINGATADTTTLSGGSTMASASKVTLGDNEARVMTYGGNGMWANATSAGLTGGGTSLTMNSSGATFSNASGGPVKVTGVANGTSKYDAVNYGQLQDVERLASRGIASVTAMTNIPQVEQGKTFSVGAGIGSYNGYQALAIGASGRITEDLIFKASVGSSENGHAAFGGGVSYSW